MKKIFCLIVCFFLYSPAYALECVNVSWGEYVVSGAEPYFVYPNLPVYSGGVDVMLATHEPTAYDPYLGSAMVSLLNNSFYFNSAENFEYVIIKKVLAEDYEWRATGHGWCADNYYAGYFWQPVTEPLDWYNKNYNGCYPYRNVYKYVADPSPVDFRYKDICIDRGSGIVHYTYQYPDLVIMEKELVGSYPCPHWTELNPQCPIFHIKKYLYKYGARYFVDGSFEGYKSGVHLRQASGNEHRIRFYGRGGYEKRY